MLAPPDELAEPQQFKDSYAACFPGVFRHIWNWGAEPGVAS